MTTIYISGSPIDTSASSINISIQGTLGLNKEEIIKTINDALEKHAIKKKNYKMRFLI